MKVICKLCPNHCSLLVMRSDGEVLVTGHLCHRGEQFGRGVILGERRFVSQRVATDFEDKPFLTLRTTGEVHNEMVFKLVRHLKKMRLTRRLSPGEIAEKNPLGLDVDLVVASDEEESTPQ